MRPSLALDAGHKYELAALLLTPSRAALSQAEFEQLIVLIKESSETNLMQAYSNFERPGSVAVTAALLTRFSLLSGMSEVSDILSLAGKYMDINQIMPPEGSLWTPNIVEALLPDSVNKALDSVADFFMGLTVPTSTEYNPEIPPDMVVQTAQSPGYISALYTTLRSNIKGVEFGVAATVADTNGQTSVGWREALIGMFGAGVVGGLTPTAFNSLTNALNDGGHSASSVDASTVMAIAKEIGITELLAVL